MNPDLPRDDNGKLIKWAWPGGEFGAYGDVFALKAEEVEINKVMKLALFAQLEPNDALIMQQQPCGR